MRSFVIGHGVIEAITVHFLCLLDEVVGSHSPLSVGALFAAISREVGTCSLLEVTMDGARDNNPAILDWGISHPLIQVGIPMNFSGSFNKRRGIHSKYIVPSALKIKVLIKGLSKWNHRVQ
jgi:hypothetical protein